MNIRNFVGAALAATTLLSIGAHAAVVRVNQSAFVAGSGLITFSEFAIGTVNPTYSPASYGGGAGSPTVNFGGFFTGQSLSATPAITCPGGSPTGCVSGTPTGPSLSLAAGSPTTSIVSDGSNPSSPVLSGSPTFNGPIAILFDVNVAGVGLDGGFFDAAGGTKITAFGRDGSLLGSVTNNGTGIEFLGLVSSTGINEIAGLLFSLSGNEPFGFGIDNLRFGSAGQVVVPGGTVPEPGSLLLAALALGALGWAGKRNTVV